MKIYKLKIMNQKRIRILKILKMKTTKKLVKSEDFKLDKNINIK